jgi:hypothetical protein
LLSARPRGVITSRYRRALTRTAVNAVAAGFPVVPGAWWSADDRRFECDLAECGRSGPHPAVRAAGSVGPSGLDDGLVGHSVRHPEAALTRWNQQPYAVLVPTGETCDVVDVPVALGHRLAVRLDNRSALGPVIAAGSRWFFLTAPGGRPPALGSDILVHGRGSWIMLPPSLGPGGERVGWLVRPDRFGWGLPARDEVLRAIVPTARSISRPGLHQASSAPV